MLQCKTKWKKKKLGLICNYITTGKLDANAMVEGGEYRFYTCAENYFQIDTYAFAGQSLLISGNGANVGYVHYFDGKFNAYQRTYVLQNFSENIFYLKHYLKAYLKDRIAKEVNAGNIPFIKLDTLTDMNVLYPADIKEQEKIANILSTCDEVIEKTEETIEKYKQIKAGMMQDLFTRGLDKNGKLRPTYEQAPDLYKYSEELDRYIPKDWEVDKLEELTDYISRGISPIYSDKETEYKILNQACIYRDKLKFENIKFITENCWCKILQDKKVYKNDVFINSTGTGTLGRVNLITNSLDNHTFDSHVTVIRFNKNGNPYFYCNYLNNKKQQEYIEINCVTGSTNQIELARTPFINMPVINPSTIEQKQISNLLICIDKKINIEQEVLSKYKQIKQGLMKRLLTPPADAEIVEE